MFRSGSHTPRRSILITGFGAFPGSPRNPTERMVQRLETHRGRLARLGVDIHCAVLPVCYAELHSRLAWLTARHRPDIILHFGVAGRRRRVSVETRAINRASPIHPDASGALPAQRLVPSGEQILPATYPSGRVLASLRHAGIQAEPSRDAGDYVCNAALYHALAMRLAPQVGFIHVPKARKGSARLGKGAGRPCAADLDRAALCAVLSLAKTPRRLKAASSGPELAATAAANSSSSRRAVHFQP